MKKKFVFCCFGFEINWLQLSHSGVCNKLKNKVRRSVGNWRQYSSFLLHLRAKNSINYFYEMQWEWMRKICESQLSQGRLSFHLGSCWSVKSTGRARVLRVTEHLKQLLCRWTVIWDPLKGRKLLPLYFVEVNRWTKEYPEKTKEAKQGSIMQQAVVTQF